jgi:CARDB
MCFVRVLMGRWVLGWAGALTLTMGCLGCRKPDLVIDSGPPKVDLAKTGVPGGSMRLGPWTIRNRGNAATHAAGGKFANGYYLSPDPVITPDDRLLTGVADTDCTDLAPGQTYTFTGDRQILIPRDVKPGTYYFGLLVDRTNRVDESDKSNNYTSIRIGIVAAPE